MSTLNSRSGWGGSFGKSSGNADPMSAGTGSGLPSRKDPALWRPDQTKSQPTVIQVMTTTETIHRDDGFELEEYGLDTKRAPPEDIEAFAQTRSKVQLPDEVSDTAIRDGTSVDSRGSFGAK
ncbi:unnamed protein product [Rhizoctonia solani]|uniref:Uncharacterized protein n=4 Tax=Rhizoctonia solani TaxID=456999 RepID=A0A8H3DN81_9AGAM|nr:unnamed protein product [Rhizoctonia solani]CAE6538708.1 unnamed protein product [Rhizoctonia solani]